MKTKLAKKVFSQITHMEYTYGRDLIDTFCCRASADQDSIPLTDEETTKFIYRILNTFNTLDIDVQQAYIQGVEDEKEGNRERTYIPYKDFDLRQWYIMGKTNSFLKIQRDNYITKIVGEARTYAASIVNQEVQL